MSSLSTDAIERLRDLLAALTNDWQHRDWLLAALSENYPERHDTATRMLVRDMRWLKSLGFLIARSPEHHEPHFRILGHARFGEETPTKYCRRCDQWRPLDDFTADKNRSSGKMIYCRYCNRASEWDSSHPRESATPRQQGRKLAWKPTMIDGVEYESRTAAAKALGIAPSTLSRQLRRSADVADASEEE